MREMKLSLNANVDILYGEDELYKSNIQDMLEDYIFISLPVNNGQYLTLNSGEQIDLITYQESGDVYKFKCNVLDRVIEDELRLYKLSKPFNILRVQRRNFVRVNTTKIIEYAKEKNIIDELKPKFLKAVLLDLSGGGMKIKVEEKMRLNDILLIDLKGDYEKIHLKGKVVRIDKETEKDKEILGIEFINIDYRTREKIIRMVFSIMRKQMELL